MSAETPAPPLAAHVAAGRPDWTNRRRVVFWILRYLAGAGAVELVSAIALAAAGKFDGWIAGFLLSVTLATIAFASLVVGAYVFQASYEAGKFLDFLAGLKPHKPE